MGRQSRQISARRAADPDLQSRPFDQIWHPRTVPGGRGRRGDPDRPERRLPGARGDHGRRNVRRRPEPARLQRPLLGRKTHVSARYHLTHGRRSEDQSSSGIIVSTGAGSAGWPGSVLNGSAGVVEPFAGAKAVAPVREGFRFAYDAQGLCFSVREPFVSKGVGGGDSVGQRPGRREAGGRQPDAAGRCDIQWRSQADYLAFHFGAIASISVAKEKARLVAALGRHW